MGQCYRFICQACGYTAEVSGGKAAGFYTATNTYECFDCKELADLVIRSKRQP
jgi:hypothetical protein